MKQYNTKQYAEKLGVTPGRVRQLYRAGKLDTDKVKASKPGRDIIIEVIEE